MRKPRTAASRAVRAVLLGLFGLAWMTTGVSMAEFDPSIRGVGSIVALIGVLMAGVAAIKFAIAFGAGILSGVSRAAEEDRRARAR